MSWETRSGMLVRGAFKIFLVIALNTSIIAITSGFSVHALPVTKQSSWENDTVIKVLTKERRLVLSEVISVSYDRGRFQRQGTLNWTETSQNGGMFQFIETAADGSSIYLYDPTRDVRIILDIEERIILFALGFEQLRDLYTITDVELSVLTEPLPESPLQPDRYNLVVSFASFGTGIDFEAKNLLDIYLSSLGPRVKIVKVPWGREGEIDYCVNYNSARNINTEVINQTIAGMMMSRRANVIVNTPCRKQ